MTETTQQTQPAPASPALIIPTGESVPLLPNGAYTGLTVRAGVRTQKWEDPEEGEKTLAYFDITVLADASTAYPGQPELTYSLPLKVRDDGNVAVPKSGRLTEAMALFGHVAAPGGQPNDLATIFVGAESNPTTHARPGRRVGFVAQQQPGRNGGTFTVIVKGSLRPL